MSNELDARWRVAVDLLAKGASEVFISGEQILVRRIPNNQPASSPVPALTNVNLNVSAHSSATSVVAVRNELAEIQSELVERRSSEATGIKQKMAELEGELSKRHPSKKRLKGFLKWAAGLDWTTYTKLAKLIMENVGGAG